MKRAGSSDLAVMQGSGYHQRDKTRWRTLYWTVREIIQRKLAIIPWHSFAASNSEGTNYFFLTFVFCFVQFFPCEQTSVCLREFCLSVCFFQKRSIIDGANFYIFFLNFKFIFIYIFFTIVKGLRSRARSCYFNCI